MSSNTIKIKILACKDIFFIFKMRRGYITSALKHKFSFFIVLFREFLALTALFLSLTRLRNLLLKFCPKATYFALGAYHQQKPIGWAFLRITQKLPNGKLIAHAGIRIEEDFQGLGIGYELMRNLISLAKKNNVQEIIIYTLPDNKRAITLYQKLGFVMRGESFNKLYKESMLILSLRFNGV